MSVDVIPGFRRPAVVGAAALVALTIAACGGDEAPPPAQQPPPAEVVTVTVQSGPVTNVIEVPGRLQAVRMAEVRARVNGIVQRRLYQEGSDVRAGQALFAIDPAEFRAQASAAQAALARATASAANAQQDVTRYQGLVAQQALSQQEYDAAVARLRTAEADVALARAQVQSAQLNLGYTTVTAPIAGRAGRAEVTEGALVNGASGTLLTMIEQVNPIFVNFSQSSSELLALRRDIASGALDMPTLRGVEAHLVLEDGTAYPRVGKLNFLDLGIDEETGTAALRAEFPNPDQSLVPGQFVRVRISAGVRPEGMRIPQRAVTVTPQGATVMIVNDSSKAEARNIVLGPMQGSDWAVLGGLAPGDRVIIAGQQKIGPGVPVRVVPDTAATQADSGKPAAK